MADVRQPLQSLLFGLPRLWHIPGSFACGRLQRF